MTYEFNANLVKGYDIRGVYEQDLLDEDAYYIGRCIASCVDAGGTLGVGYDYRESSPALYKRLVEGITSLGVHVADFGHVTTPTLYYTVRTRGELDGGVMITGSHNALKYNGFKMLMRDREISGTELRNFFDLGQALPDVSVVGSVKPCHVIDDYVNFIKGHIDQNAFLSKSVVWGTSGGVAKEVLEQLMPFLPKGHLLAVPPKDQRAPDPLDAANAAFMRESILRNGADLGVAFDGDADRCVVFDAKGAPVLADNIFCFLAEEFLKTQPGATFVADSKLAQALGEGVRVRGGKLLYVPTGHTNIKTAMRSSGAVLGGEMSGHYFFPYGGGHAFDDGVFAAVQILNMMGVDSWNVIKDRLPPIWVTGEIRVPISKEQLALLEKVWVKHTPHIEQIPGGAMRYGGEAGWFFARASRTEALVSVRAEGKSQSDFAFLCEVLRDSLEDVLEITVDFCCE